MYTPPSTKRKGLPLAGDEDILPNQQQVQKSCQKIALEAPSRFSVSHLKLKHDKEASCNKLKSTITSQVEYQSNESRNDVEERSSTPPVVSSSSSSSSSVHSSFSPAKRQTKRFRVDQTTMWDQRFKELREYKAQHGDCLVPRTWHTNPQLGTWVNTQRKQYRLNGMGKATQMTPDRLVALDSLGFTWSKCEKRDWEGRLEDLRQYKEKVGDCLVPQRYADNVQLGTWVNNQRTMYKLHIAGETTSLTKERIQALEAVGFKWYVASGRGSSCKEMKKSRGEVL